MTYAKGEGLGVYVRGGLQAGIDVGAAGELGTSTNRRSFDGLGVNKCDAILGIGGCGAANKAGYTGNFVGGPKNPGIPVATSAGGTATASFTWKDFKDAVKEFIRQGLVAARQAGALPPGS